MVWPRQVGKSSLAWQLTAQMGQGAMMLDLEPPSEFAKLAEPELFLAPLAALAGTFLVLESAALALIRAIEIKHSAAPKLGKGFAEALHALNLDRGFVIAPVNEPYLLSQLAMVLPLSDIARIWQ